MAAVVSAVVMKIKVAKKAAADAKRSAETLTSLVTQNTLMTCRLVIYNEHFSTDEKLDAYVVYRDQCHGNHKTKTYMDSVVGCDVDEYLSRHRKEKQ